MHTISPSSVFFDARAASQRIGVSMSLLRLWESRYGWPCPRRNEHGQRRFSATEIHEIAQIVARVQAGCPIGRLIVDGRPQLPAAQIVASEPLAQAAMNALPQPGRPGAGHLRGELIACLRRRAVGRAHEWLQRAAVECVPVDRAPAAWLPTLVLLRAWHERGQALTGAATLEALARDGLAKQGGEATQRISA